MDDLSIVHGRPAARAFRLLGVLGAETLPGWVIGPLIGAQDTEDVLDTLVDANLLRLVDTDAAGQPGTDSTTCCGPTPHVPPPTTTRAPNAVPPWNGCWEAGSRWPSRREACSTQRCSSTPPGVPRADNRTPACSAATVTGATKPNASASSGNSSSVTAPSPRRITTPTAHTTSGRPSNPPRQTDPTADQTGAEAGPWHRRTSPSVNRNEGSTGKIVPPAGHATPRNALDGPRRPDGWQVIEDRHPGRIRSIEHSTSARTLGVCEC